MPDTLRMWREWSKKVPSDRLFFYARQFFPENGTFFNILRGHIQEVPCLRLWYLRLENSQHLLFVQMLPLAVISPQTFRADDGDAKETAQVAFITCSFLHAQNKIHVLLH
jgi:hypothetical protein